MDGSVYLFSQGRSRTRDTVNRIKMPLPRYKGRVAKRRALDYLFFIENTISSGETVGS